MNVRRSVVGVAVMIGASVAFAMAGFAAPAAAPPDARSSPAASPAAIPTVLRTPSVEPSAGSSPAPQLSPIPGLRLLPTMTLGSPPPAQPYAVFVRTAQRLPGVLDLIRKDDELYLDLKPENFDRPYIILPSLASGVGGDAFAGRVFDPLVVIFKRVDKRVLWITPNSRYVADKGTSAAASLAVSVADSVIQATPVIAEDPDKTHVVINPSVFLSDFEGIGTELGRAAPSTAPSLPGLLLIAARPSFSVDATKSYYTSTKAFPQNDEIGVNLTFNGPPNALPTVPDGRGIPILVHYSIVAPPAHDPTYVPRYADDRIGYFITARKHFGADLSSLPTQRFIRRWNLDAGPIVFTLTDEIPPEYRATVRNAILAWNVAFAKIGYPHALEVHDPPSDPHFDPDDARYNTVRWITSDAPGFVAISQDEADPDTGQMLRATVVVDGESVRSVRRGYVDKVLPLQAAPRDAFAVPAPGNDGDASALVAPEMDEDYAAGIASEAALGMSMLVSSPHVSEAQRTAYAQGFVFSTVLHEVGHTLGLRHNFEGSAAYTYAQLHDPAFTRQHGTTASVMDYTPPNIAPPGARQATYFPDRIGAYDTWAIRYGYTKLPAGTSDGELPALRAIASESTEPDHAYATDEDVSGQLALDPRAQRFDLSSDPLAYAQGEFAIDGHIADGLLRRYPGDTRSYQDLRQTFVTLLNADLSAATIATRYIGGIYTSRAHRGQPGAGLPFTPVPRAEQRRAFALLERNVLSSHALQFAPALLNSVVPLRYGNEMGQSGVQREDFPIREVAAQLQDRVIAAMFNPTVIDRIADESLRARPGETMDVADLFGWTNAALFDDLGDARIAPVHADLQRRFLDLELEIALLPSTSMDQLSLPREVQSIARFEVTRLRARLDGALRATRDVSTQAHLEDMRARIDAALHATVTAPL